MLFYTSELEEVQLVCDRAIVIFGGRVVDVLPVEIADEAALTRAAYGLPRDAKADVGMLAEPVRRSGGRAMIRLLRRHGWVVGPVRAVRRAVRRHQADPARLRRRRFRLAGARGAALRLRRRGADRSSSSPAASTCRSPR